MGEMKGIDISSYQGEINWKKVKKDGIDFVIIRSILQNGKPDTRFEEYYTGAVETGYRPDVYVYIYDLIPESSRNRSKKVVDLIRGRNIKRVWLDIEYAAQRNLPKNRLTEIINAAAEVIRTEGFEVGVYCNQDWYDNVLDVSKLPYMFWIARYGKNDGTAQGKYRPSAAEIWQYTSKGSIAGIKGNVDLNICRNDMLFKMDGADDTTVPTGRNNNVYRWQEACIADGYSFPRYGQDGKWGDECEEVAAKALVSTKSTPSSRQYERVGLAQELLIAYGYSCGKNGVDKRCGKDTQAAVKAYQCDHKLKPDGCIGSDTWRDLLITEIKNK